MRQKLSKAVVVPDEKASDEEKAAYRKAIGVPDSPDGYELTVPDDMPEYIKPDEEQTKAFKAYMHENGVPAQYAKIAADFYWNSLKESAGKVEANDEQRRKDAEAKLRQEWGGDYDTNLVLMKKGAERYGEEFAEYLDETGLGNDPRIANALRDLGAYSQEDPMHGGATPEEKATLEDQEANIRSNPDYWDSSSPNYERLQKQMQEISAKIAGKGPIVGSEGRRV